MKSDEELGRLLEGWLEDEARPIPRDVLESTLESVARTPQVGARRRGAWLQSPFAGIASVAAAVLLMVSAGVLLRDRLGLLEHVVGPPGSSEPGMSRVWDPVVDFGRWSNHLNPTPDSYGNADAWSYLTSPTAHDPGQYRLLTTFVDNQWQLPGYVAAYLERGGVMMSPGVRDQTWHAILGWKSPISGTIRIAGSADLVQDPCPGLARGVGFSIDHVSQALLDVLIPAGGYQTFDLTVSVQRGESVYFVILPGSDSSCDFTLLKFTISGMERD